MSLSFYLDLVTLTFFIECDFKKLLEGQMLNIVKVFSPNNINNNINFIYKVLKTKFFFKLIAF